VDQAARPTGTTVVTMVGSDCSVGKMVTALELHSGAESKGHTSEFVATGQTGILIAGKGVPLDRLIGDFMAGTIELAVKQAIEPRHPRWVFVEGQGSLIHPSYSGVTLGLLHGSLPDALILCHRADLKLVRGGYQVPIPPLGELVTLYETAAAWVCPPGKTHPKVVGLAVNTSMLSDDEAKAYLSEQSAILSLPATDPVRYGVAPLLDALEDAFPCR
jgi:uncharacterized NAD-dependent epimerase/dehydratase family protein